MKKWFVLINLILLLNFVSATWTPPSEPDFKNIYSITNGVNATFQWFKGLFNWTTGDSYSSFDGNTLSFNETRLNETIDSRFGMVNVNSSEYWDNLDTPSDIPGSEYWYNHTSEVDTLYGDSYRSTYNATYDSFIDTNTEKGTSGDYLYNDSDSIYFNDTLMNITINQLDTDTHDGNASSICSDSQVLLGNGSCMNSDLYFDDTDTTYTAGSNLSLIGTEFSLDTTSLKNWLDTIYQSIGNYLIDSDEPNLNVNSSDYWDSLNTYNSTQMENSGGTLNILVSWITSLFYTKSEVDTSLAEQDECSEITGCVENAITSTNVAWINESNTFTPAQTFSNNITVEGVKFESDSTNHRIYDNATCLILTGDTSTFNIC